MENELRTLVVMRHAKAAATGTTDAERELTAAGARDALRAGEWLREFGVQAEHALVSTAVRTRQTWNQVRAGAGWSLDADFDSTLYSAGPETALDVLRLVPTGVGSVVLVGHNPTVSQLAQLLSDGLGEPSLLAAMSQGYPPASLTVLEFEGDWGRLGFGDARVTGFHVARG